MQNSTENLNTVDVSICRTTAGVWIRLTIDGKSHIMDESSDAFEKVCEVLEINISDHRVQTMTDVEWMDWAKGADNFAVVQSSSFHEPGNC